MSDTSELSEIYKKTKTDLDINLYDKVLELRKFEIENFWKRTLFFWGTIALIYAGFFNANLNDYQIIIPLIGLLFNLIFSLSTRGSKYWQEHWETIAVVYENELKFSLFSHDTQNLVNKNSKSVLTKPYRFSVSKLTMLLSDLSVFLWLFLWIQQLIELFKDSKLKTLISQAGVYILFNASEVLYYAYKFQVTTLELIWFIQALSLFSLIFIFMYNGKKGKNLKYLFYAFYPVHLLIIGLIKIFRF